MNKIKDLIDRFLENDITNQKLIKLYYDIGKIIDNQKIDLLRLELNLQEKYGIVIAFTRRNLKNMINFSKYDNINLYKDVTWKNILIIKNNQELLELCLKYKPTKQELENYIKKNQKLHKNKKIEDDDTLLELKNLKNMLRR